MNSQALPVKPPAYESIYPSPSASAPPINPININLYGYPTSNDGNIYTIEQDDRLNAYPYNDPNNEPGMPQEFNATLTKSRKPSSFMGLAIASLLFFLPCGICAVYHSCRSSEYTKRNDLGRGKRHSCYSILFSILAMLLSCAVAAYFFHRCITNLNYSP